MGEDVIETWRPLGDLQTKEIFGGLRYKIS
jgi:hypothetical protein